MVNNTLRIKIESDDVFQFIANDCTLSVENWLEAILPMEPMKSPIHWLSELLHDIGCHLSPHLSETSSDTSTWRRSVNGGLDWVTSYLSPLILRIPLWEKGAPWMECCIMTSAAWDKARNTTKIVSFIWRVEYSSWVQDEAIYNHSSRLMMGLQRYSSSTVKQTI